MKIGNFGTAVSPFFHKGWSSVSSAERDLKGSIWASFLNIAKIRNILSQSDAKKLVHSIQFYLYSAKLQQKSSQGT